MGKKDIHTRHLTPEQIQRYLKGELSAGEMHEVERILMDSDFYSEAAEGFELSRKAGVETDRVLTNLRHQLNEKMKGHQKRKLLTWPAWSAAASIVLAIAGYFVIRYVEHENELKAMKASEAAIEEILSSINNADTRDTLNVVVPEQEEYLASYDPASTSLEPGIAQRLRDVQPPTAENEPADAGQENQVPARQTVAGEQARLNEAPAEASGQKEQADADILAKQAPAAAKSRSKAQLSSALPAGGMANYQKYLDDSLRYPAQALENKTEGKVALSFRVDESGRPSAIRVEESLGDGCDQEAVRLIREGPDWQAPKDGSRLKQTVVFRLRDDH